MKDRLQHIDVFQFVTAPEAATYRAIVQTFHDARQRFQAQLRPEELLSLLRSGAFEVDLSDVVVLHDRLDRLCEWGVLARAHDGASVERIADYYRRRLIYRLTEQGSAAHEATLAVERVVSQSGSLQQRLLVEIREALTRLTRVQEPSVLERAFRDLYGTFGSLTREADRFMAGLQGFLSDLNPDDETFSLHKEALLAYIGGFVQEAGVDDLRDRPAHDVLGLRDAGHGSPRRRRSGPPYAANVSQSQARPALLLWGKPP